MNKRVTVFGLILAAVLMAASAQARCEINYTRTACNGQEAIAFKKCNGNQSCVKLRDSRNVQECWQLAVRACENDRLNITKYKVITASYGGQTLIGGFDEFGNPDANGTNFCTKNRPDLNQCN